MTLCKKYNLQDPRLADSLRNVTKTFCNRTFDNMEPIVKTIVSSMAEKFFLDHETVCMSYGTFLLPGPVDLFKFLNEIIDTTLRFPRQEVLSETLALCGRLLKSFQKEYSKVINEAENMDMKIFCSLTNSNVKFLSSMRQFIERIEILKIFDKDMICLV